MDFGQLSFETLTGHRVMHKDMAGLILEAKDGSSMPVSYPEARRLIMASGSTSFAVNDAYDYLRQGP